MNSINIEPLRKECKKLMVDCELELRGNQSALAEMISTPEDTVNTNSLCMALSGYRQSLRSKELLERLRDQLITRLELLYPENKGD